MSDIFREEALAELRGRGGPGDVLRAGPRWLVWSFAALLALVAVGVAAAVTIHISEYARGRAIVGADGRSVTAVLPLGFRGEVRPGSTVRLDFHDVRRTARITTIHLGPGELVARTRLVTPLSDDVPHTGRASVRVGTETLFHLLRG